jgi:hypothetical protein
MLRNNTIVRNSCRYAGPTSWGGGLFAYPLLSSFQGSNNIVWGNEATNDPNWSGKIVMTHSCSDPLLTGTGNIDDDPLFAGPVENDLHLTFLSPCKDAGDNGSIGAGTADFEGDPRITGGLVDMGADEFFEHLYHLGSTAPGSAVSIRVVGRPQEPVTLGLGSSVLDPPRKTPYGNLHLAPPIAPLRIGTIPATGILIHPATVPGFWSPGDLEPFQALIGPLGNPSSVLSNLMVIEID